MLSQHRFVLEITVITDNRFILAMTVFRFVLEMAVLSQHRFVLEMSYQSIDLYRR
jgi:hypothetical protein